LKPRNSRPWTQWTQFVPTFTIADSSSDYPAPLPWCSHLGLPGLGDINRSKGNFIRGRYIAPENIILLEGSIIVRGRGGACGGRVLELVEAAIDDPETISEVLWPRATGWPPRLLVAEFTVSWSRSLIGERASLKSASSGANVEQLEAAVINLETAIGDRPSIPLLSVCNFFFFIIFSCGEDEERSVAGEEIQNLVDVWEGATRLEMAAAGSEV
jgi:hypothetical protein